MQSLSDDGSIDAFGQPSTCCLEYRPTTAGNPWCQHAEQRIGESLVKTARRDCMCHVSLSTEPRSLFKDYGEEHPHGGLKCCSPQEFKRLAGG